MMNTMESPMTRAEFERRFNLLREQLCKGKMFFADVKMTLGIQKVRYLPNGRIDFLSVNESARLQANMMSQYDNEAFKAMMRDRGQQEAPSGGGEGQTEEVPADNDDVSDQPAPKID